MGSMVGGAPEGWESGFCLRQIWSANLKSRNAEQATRKNNLEIGEQVQVSYENTRVIGIQMALKPLCWAISWRENFIWKKMRADMNLRVSYY